MHGNESFSIERKNHLKSLREILKKLDLIKDKKFSEDELKIAAKKLISSIEFPFDGVHFTGINKDDCLQLNQLKGKTLKEITSLGIKPMPVYTTIDFSLKNPEFNFPAKKLKSGYGMPYPISIDIFPEFMLENLILKDFQNKDIDLFDESFVVVFEVINNHFWIDFVEMVEGFRKSFILEAFEKLNKEIERLEGNEGADYSHYLVFYKMVFGLITA